MTALTFTQYHARLYLTLPATLTFLPPTWFQCN